jgi:ACS family pantothenate transporter-like MFS transporter
MEMTSIPDKKAIQPTRKITALEDHQKFLSNKDTDSDPASIVSTNPVHRQKWYQYFSPTDTPEERRLILKLDALIMVFVFLAYWAKVLDSSATSTAYVSGMKEDLGLYGNELNYLNTVYM